MDCLKINCNIVGNDRMITCWLCLGTYHLKCTGLKARDADALADPAKSLQWTCSQCKQINLDFYKFFKSYKEDFDLLNKDFLSIQAKFLKFGELFTKFPSLDNFASTLDIASPKRKKTSDKSPIIPVINFSSSVATSNRADGNNFIPPSSEPMITNQEFNNSSRSAPLVINSQQEVLNTVTDSDNASSFPSVAPNITPIVRNPLRAIPPKKTIFISRLASETTPDDIIYYINNKIGFSPDILIYKFQYAQPRSISSFKITVSDDLFLQLVDLNFWPNNTLVREYIFKERQNGPNIAVLPQRAQKTSKN